MVFGIFLQYVKKIERRRKEITKAMSFPPMETINTSSESMLLAINSSWRCKQHAEKTCTAN